MRISLITTAGLLALGVAACSPNFSGTTATGAKAVGAASTAPGSSSQMPQSANSLPPGDSVSAPLSGNAGRLGGGRL